MLKLSFQLFDNILIWNPPLVCPVILDSKLFLPNWAVVPAPEVMQPLFLIKHSQRLHLAQRFRPLTGTPQRRAPRIVAVANDGISILIQNCNRFAGQGQYSLYEEVSPAFARNFPASLSRLPEFQFLKGENEENFQA